MGEGTHGDLLALPTPWARWSPLSRVKSAPWQLLWCSLLPSPGSAPVPASTSPQGDSSISLGLPLPALIWDRAWQHPQCPQEDQSRRGGSCLAVLKHISKPTCEAPTFIRENLQVSGTQVGREVGHQRVLQGSWPPLPQSKCQEPGCYARVAAPAGWILGWQQ